MILELLKFLHLKETELQTETEIGQQKIMQFPQQLGYSSILNEPVIAKNSGYLKVSLPSLDIFSGFFFNLQNPLWDLYENTSCPVAHNCSHARKSFHLIAFSIFHQWNICVQWNPDFTSLQGKRKLVRKMGEFEKLGVKLQSLTEEGKLLLVRVIGRFEKLRVR